MVPLQPHRNSGEVDARSAVEDIQAPKDSHHPSFHLFPLLKSSPNSLWNFTRFWSAQVFRPVRRQSGQNSIFGLTSGLPVTRPKCRFLAQTPLRQTTIRARITPQNAHRCGQPGQQHGRRIPSLSSEHTLSTCCRLVSSFLTEMVQQIHSLRASGVMSSQATSAFASDASAFRRSAGRLCTTPPEIRTVVIKLSRKLKD